jgi:signal transduction histidine kinase
VRGEGGALVGITLILSDITNLRRIDEMKSGLLSTVSHELRTPLTSLQMALHVLLEERLGALNAEQTEMLVAARDDAERLRTILVNLLEIARYEAGSQQLSFAPTAPRDLAELSVAPLRSAFADQGVELKLAIEPETAPVMADPARAQLVLGNLLQNALQHTQAGGTVVVTAAPAPPAGVAHGGAAATNGAGMVRFTVADSGAGIPQEYLDHVFDRFFQVPGSRGGAGLGLAIAKEVVQAHGGAIGVESHAGGSGGATFWFTLPAAGAASPAGAAPAAGDRSP